MNIMHVHVSIHVYSEYNLMHDISNFWQTWKIIANSMNWYDPTGSERTSFKFLTLMLLYLSQPKMFIHHEILVIHMYLSFIKYHPLITACSRRRMDNAKIVFSYLNGGDNKAESSLLSLFWSSPATMYLHQHCFNDSQTNLKNLSLNTSRPPLAKPPPPVVRSLLLPDYAYQSHHGFDQYISYHFTHIVYMYWSLWKV